ncbi:2-oxo acid dehydrogenase subunit E2 [Methylobacterium frigidaeris]|uniref:Dihydrolipoamide acetyltransferase component of pyruvate dehydrogenase complex n=1 Tax=Methylobacterium frigidaeris TaxID=2038277 RepID=A0AA37HFP2_9HYPH|nr:2-oxo acid dehydrogenase subunit E2 [Methylobacterium frigidaeris]PIK71223.1 branched-chain alpha-keto acid dehydrogenase subunit E2 [Methylobacterium frigidaeris]GJD64952.1 Dihydrolipoyllysine-residue acetyltransferase component of pyruvate dehydrogenase complex [Methylobacterium frigidaeris]
MSASLPVALPDIGDFKDVPVVEILVKPGDRIAVDDLLISIESDKATMEVPSPVAGVVAEILVAPGIRVSKGTPILTVDTSGEGAAPPPAAAPQPAPEAAPVVNPTPAAVAPAAVPPAASDTHATPSVRAYARELGVDLAGIPGTGPQGRILREDVLAFVRGQMAAPSPSPAAVPAASSSPTPTSGIGAGLPAWPQVDHGKFGPVRRDSLSRIQQISGQALTRNWLTIPHVTNFDHADVTETEALRRELNGAGRPGSHKVTMVAILIKAAAAALRAYPRFNAALDGDGLILKDYVHVGFAVDTPRGLLVPVVRDCDRKGLVEIAQEMGELAEQARSGTLPPSAMQGGGFSVSSLGGIGGDGFTPIINAPEVAILGAARSRIEPVWDGSTFQPRLILPLSLSWDHRAVDGAAAARFLSHLAAVLTDLRRGAL